MTDLTNPGWICQIVGRGADSFFMASKSKRPAAGPEPEMKDLIGRLKAALKAVDDVLAEFRRVRNGPDLKPRAGSRKKR